MRAFAILLVVSAVLFFSQTVRAEVIILTGAGTSQCGKYLNDLNESEFAEYIVASWLQGYLSGRNVERFEHGKPVLDIAGHEGQARWLNNYCEENPLDNLWQGAEALWETLKARQNKD